jgi:hypothetical protein
VNHRFHLTGRVERQLGKREFLEIEHISLSNRTLRECRAFLRTAFSLSWEAFGSGIGTG